MAVASFMVAIEAGMRARDAVEPIKSKRIGGLTPVRKSDYSRN
jgi:hypothetical protein